MKSLSVPELDSVVCELQTYVGDLLQEVSFLPPHLGLGLWNGQKLRWIWIDLSPNCPLILPLEESPQSFKKTKKPLTLFLQANFKNKELTAVKRSKTYGRLVVMEFDDKSIETRLFPHGQNILLQTPEKQLALFKPKDLKPLESKIMEETRAVRGLEELIEEWQGSKGKPKSQENKEDSKKKKIKKLEKSISKVAADLDKKKNSAWKEVGEWIVQNQSIEVKEEWKGYVDLEKSLSWNIERCFKKAKDNVSKLKGGEERLQVLEKELNAILSGDWVEKKPQESLLAQAKVKGRQQDLGEGLMVYSGKSGADNLKLLRKAKPWHLWLHVKDMPGSHGILRCNKNQKISDEKLRQAAQWLLERSMGAKKKVSLGGAFQVLVAEVRYVRPIKGDRLGRVNYQNERVLSIRLDTSSD